MQPFKIHPCLGNWVLVSPLFYFKNFSFPLFKSFSFRYNSYSSKFILKGSEWFSVQPSPLHLQNLFLAPTATSSWQSFCISLSPVHRQPLTTPSVLPACSDLPIPDISCKWVIHFIMWTSPISNSQAHNGWWPRDWRARVGVRWAPNLCRASGGGGGGGGRRLPGGPGSRHRVGAAARQWPALARA